MLNIYDSAGLLVRSLAAGSAPAPVTAVSLSAQPYNPGNGALILSQGGWTFAFNGLDASGAVLRNGVYLFELQNQAHGSAGPTLKFQVTVIGKGGEGVILLAAPNPVHAWQDLVTIQWQPADQPLDVRIYGLNGDLVRSLGISTPPVAWNLRSGDNEKAADGIYFVGARVPGQRNPAFFKLMVAR